MSGRLTTHVLDTAQGKPAAGMKIALWALDEDGTRRLLKTTSTNTDGRIDGPLLAGDELRIGRYEILFAAGPYFAAQGLPVAGPPFLDEVPVRFGVADAGAHYHVPLLISPW